MKNFVLLATMTSFKKYMYDDFFLFNFFYFSKIKSGCDLDCMLQHSHS
jgi:hypothetical protein